MCRLLDQELDVAGELPQVLAAETTLRRAAALSHPPSAAATARATAAIA